MFAWLRNRSLRLKVVALAMLVSAVSLVLASGSLLAWDYRQLRVDTARALSTQAQMVLENSTAAMVFQDKAAALETLATLSPNAHILMGCLYDPDGRMFAEFGPGRDRTPCPPVAPDVGTRFTASRVEVVVSTEVAGRPGGAAYLVSDLTEVASRVRLQLWIGAGILAVVLGVAFVLSSFLETFISAPIVALLETARHVSSHDDYSLRARKTTSDEFGVLVDAFNDMLGRIERSQQERIDLLVREREANRLKDEFLMTLSHELRTPLNGIQGWTRMLISGIVAPAGVQRALQRIERNALAQGRLVDDLLDVSRLTSGKFRLDETSLDLASVIDQAIETVRPDAESNSITIERAFSASAVPMRGDPDRLQQVIWNLLSNAVKFSPPHSRVIVSLLQQHDAVEVQVHDSGVGIATSFLPFVFEPFRQQDATSTRAYGGLGLGLSIVRRIVELHGGTIEAASPGIGSGATFTVRLPTRVERLALGAPQRRPGQPEARSLAGVSVLVVDDDEDTREMLVTLLTSAGADTRQASSVNDALALTERTVFTVLITDIAMPGQDGYALLAALRGAGGRVTVLTIALTAQATPADRERALSAGFDRYISKPFEPDALLVVVRELIATSAT